MLAACWKSACRGSSSLGCNHAMAPAQQGGEGAGRSRRQREEALGRRRSCRKLLAELLNAGGVLTCRCILGHTRMAA